MILSSLQPLFGPGGNYAPGYIGFQFRSDAIANIGIAHFTRFDRLSQIKVAHCFIVASPTHCIEALARQGVCSGSLLERFADPHLAVFFRKPTGYSPALGQAIANTAAAQLGRPYDYRLLAGQALANLWLCRRVLSKKSHNALLSFFDRAAAFLCSELAAYSLDAQPTLHDRGCLSDPDAVITPQRLFEDPAIFSPWHASPPGAAERSASQAEQASP